MSILTFILLLPSYTFSINGSNVFELNGQIKQLKTGRIYLSYLNYRDEQVKDSCTIVDGRFHFKGEIKEPTKATLKLKEITETELNIKTFYLEPSRIKITLIHNNFKDAKITGSNTETEVNKHQLLVNRIAQNYKSLLDSLSKEKDPVLISKMNERLLPYYTELDQVFFKHYLEQPDCFLAPFTLKLRLRNVSADSIKMFYDNMSREVKESRDGRLLATALDLVIGGSPGAIAKDFIKKDLNREEIQLSKYRGKYVLLDFWASWCVPCRRYSPKLINLYTMYKDKGIEFIGISDDDRNPDAWKKAIDKDGLLWPQILRGLDRQKKIRNERNPNDINENFGIQVLPTKILIDPKGIIIGRFTDDEIGLETLLDSIFRN